MIKDTNYVCVGALSNCASPAEKQGSYVVGLDEPYRVYNVFRFNVTDHADEKSISNQYDKALHVIYFLRPKVKIALPCRWHRDPRGVCVGYHLINTLHVLVFVSCKTKTGTCLICYLKYSSLGFIISPKISSSFALAMTTSFNLSQTHMSKIDVINLGKFHHNHTSKHRKYNRVHGSR